MNNDIEQKFIQDIKNTLSKNGYPNNKVALSMEKMYEIASNKGLNFNKIREKLKSMSIDTQLTDEKILFFPQKPATSFPGLEDIDLESLKGMDKTQLTQKLTEIVKNMSPDQLSALQNIYQNLNEDQKADILRKSQEMGL